jgi:peptide/nickel transport system permease protein
MSQMDTTGRGFLRSGIGSQEGTSSTLAIRRHGISVPKFKFSSFSGKVKRIQPGLVTAWLVIATVAGWSLLPYWFSGYSGTVGIARQQLRPPGVEHWLGTDALGRDLLARIIYGASQSLSGAVVAVSVGLVIGTGLGLVAGSVRGKTESFLMRGVDVLLSIPQLLLSLSIVILLGFGTVNAALAVGITSIASFARLARSEVVRVRARDYVEAAIGSGGTFSRVMLRHILPNSLTSIIALAALQFGSAILAISTLGFLGYGAPPPTPEWGLLIAEGRNYIARAWWLTTAPGVIVIVVVLSASRISQSFATERR